MELVKRNATEDLSPILNTIKTNLNQERDTLQEQINNTKQIISAQEREIATKSNEIRTREEILKDKDNNVSDNRSLLNVRDRMLQLSQDKNIYKQKVIYTLIALIISVFMIVICGYIFFGGSPKP